MANGAKIIVISAEKSHTNGNPPLARFESRFQEACKTAEKRTKTRASVVMPSPCLDREDQYSTPTYHLLKSIEIPELDCTVRVLIFLRLLRRYFGKKTKWEINNMTQKHQHDPQNSRS
jgi:hypothetical protein